MDETDTLDDLVRISAAAISEAKRTDPDAVLHCAGWPTGSALLEHLGSHFGWVVAAIGATERPHRPIPPRHVLQDEWFTRECERFVEVLTVTSGTAPAWTLDGSDTVGFWRRRSIYEIARHVWDFRTAGGARPAPPDELAPARFADGVSEHLEVFLARSRSTLDPLPGTLKFIATDTEATWILTPEWQRPAEAAAQATVSATAGELALLMWERADALEQSQFRLDGDERVVAAFQAAPIHR